MRASVKNITVRIITIMLVGIVGLFIANQAIFLHVHKLSDGTVIYHAHPYDKSGDTKPIKSHQHSNAEFTFLQNLETLFPVVFLAIILIPYVCEIVYFSQQMPIYSLIRIKQNKGRAPPLQ